MKKKIGNLDMNNLSNHNKDLRLRINELAKKQKSKEGLTKEEKIEQGKLRKKFLIKFKKSFRSRLESLQVFDKEGNEVTPKKIINIQRKRGLRK